MKKRRPRHAFEIRDSSLVRAVDAHREHIRDDAIRVEVPPDDALAVWREERAAIVAGLVREALHAGTVGVHRVNLAEVGRISLEPFQIGGGKFVRWIRVAQRAEDDLPSVGRERPFSVVARCAGDAANVRTVAARDEDVHLAVVIPGVAALFPCHAEIQLSFLLRARVWIEMRRGEKHFIAAGPEKRAGRFANAGRDAMRVAAFEIEEENLIERVLRVALALKDERLAVG
jgi:hypothetical protein